jgi:hypothetical protein
MVSITSVPRAGWYGVQVLLVKKIFLYSKTTRQAMGPTKPSVKGFCPLIKLAGLCR